MKNVETFLMVESLIMFENIIFCYLSKNGSFYMFCTIGQNDLFFGLENSLIKFI